MRIDTPIWQGWSGPTVVARAQCATMAFDADQALRLTRRRDRDTARFFAGRSTEIRRFDDALADLEDRDEYDKAAEFIVYRGAPGCGKTSLVKHLRHQRGDGALFVDIDLEHLASADTLIGRVLEQASEAGSLGSRIGGRIVEALGSRLRMRDAAKDASDFVATRVAKGTKVVLHLDEAQEIDRSERSGLLKLHTTGLVVPCVFVMTGLDHTTHSLGSLGGIARLSSNAVVKMGVMAEDECVESTLMMLDELDVAGTDAEKSHAAEVVAHLSYGWPRHLRGAQRALCGELVRVNGVLGEVDADRIRRESERNRHGYYLCRLDHPILSKHRPVTLSIITKANERRPGSIGELGRLCREQMDRAGWPDLADPDKFAYALVEKGAVSTGPDGRCEIPIPSMADWAASLADDDPPSAQPTGR